MKLDGKVAIVTGAGQGIGRGIALALAREGAKVAVTDITGKENDVAKEIKKITDSIAIKVDVSKKSDAEKMAKETVKKFGRIDILVNNAGIYPFKPFVQMEENDWDRVMDINLKGTFLCTKAVVPAMMKQKSGNIVNIASIAGLIGYPNLAHYSASKAGIIGFTRTVALELGPNIRVNAIAPGGVKTPGINVVMNDEAVKQFEASVPLKRMAEPEDIANLAVFLASDDSKNITGQCIVSDGGTTIQ